MSADSVTQKRRIVITIEVHDPQDRIDLDAALSAIADHLASEWNGNVRAWVSADSNTSVGSA
jgi:hypothetical protein